MGDFGHKSFQGVTEDPGASKIYHDIIPPHSVCNVVSIWDVKYSCSHEW